MIRDRLNLQGNDIRILNEGCVVFLSTEKGIKLRVQEVQEDE